jgi:RNA polymerase sigma-70 factor, ECF subfamily
MVPAGDPVEAVFREDRGRLLATLAARFGDLDLAEDVASEAIVTALERWPVEGVPDKPLAWLTTTARRKAIDRIRRDQSLAGHLALLQLDAELTQSAQGLGAQEEIIPDDRLQMFFTCCHPALHLQAQTALTLRFLAGVSTPEVAKAFLVPVSTMAQRLVRAKRKIRHAQIPFRAPDSGQMAQRLPGVLQVIYLLFTEGYAASEGHYLVRGDLIDEAIRLARLLRRLMPDQPEVEGLLALMLLTDARRPARVDERAKPSPSRTRTAPCGTASSLARARPSSRTF